MFNFIKYQVADKRADIIMNRPEKRNSFNVGLVTELKQAFAMAESDAEVRVLRLMGAGAAFSSGADLAYIQSMQAYSYEENLADSSSLMELYKQIYTLSKPVVAQIEGAAIAGGCGLATVCDFSFAVPTAQFSYSETKIGFVPAIVMVFLLRKIGEGKAKELLLTGKIINAGEALAAGIINQVCPAETIDAEVLAFIANMCANNSPQALATTKQMIARVQSMDIDTALDYAAATNAQARMTTDCKKGIAAFVNKEKISW